MDRPDPQPQLNSKKEKALRTAEEGALRAMIIAGGPEGAAAGSSVDIEAGLKDGTLTAEQAVVLQERQLRAEMAAQMARGSSRGTQ